ncbi:MAG: KH domain-containing protein [Symploca sp. SIO3C6]|uniref:KH domain-containing protein n=1 Tax=Symploca sp. SIO1C4 TaxID=2607765 RepID=A0A6B3NIK7_9CYAN|nr:KH domain-containing protein [Symploca sp. SIO3C6]NER29068.1 KH domain-containing protein [Symploca sp. SIO1C4]NET04777.1 KH domain-containing protein [Symploca sp. SIO2B6]NET50332.1 KH domain-containing protein [Merismopedia sp. SIO2A8]
MSLNKYVPEITSASLKATSPDYESLVRFLIEPFLESPNSLSVDCEDSNSNGRVWIRLAFEGTDKGRVFGRGGRNIQAIRTLIKAIGQAAGQSVYLDIYEGSPPASHREMNSGRNRTKRSSPKRLSTPKLAPRFRSQSNNDH